MRYFVLLFIFAVSLHAQVVVEKPAIKGNSSFAIIIDKDTYGKARAEVLAYKQSIEKEGLPVYLAASEWNSPDEIRSFLKDLHSKQNLEGAVFIGDIPIPMLRDAQHLTSAFKIDQQAFNWFRTSAPSDRFYEDFDLKFKFIKQDSIRKLLFYYSLLPDSPQKIQKEIYSARIKPSVGTGDKYQLIKKYLRKAVSAKQKKNYLDSMLVFTGHGYNSESVVAYTDEMLALREQFPDMYVNGKGKLKKLNFSMSGDMKKILMTELQNPSLDVSMFHAHGEWDTQYLIEYPTPGNPQEDLEDVKLYLRSKLREANRRKKSIDEVKQYFMKELKVDESMFEGAFSDSVIAKDSALAASLDLYISDIREMKPQPKLFIFDECFNGSFHRDDYMAAEYVFGDGDVLAGVANTTNALQDQWIAQQMGLLTKGVSVGQWIKFNPQLETHLFGDPTFKFAAQDDRGLSDLLHRPAKNIKKLESLLKDSNPNFRALGIAMVNSIKGREFSPEIKNIFLSDPSYIVRLQALMCLSTNEGEEFYDVLKAGVNDPYEAIRRYSAALMGEVGKEDFIPYLVKVMLNDESPRVSGNAKNALSRINPMKSLEYAMAAIKELPEHSGKQDLEVSLTRFFKGEYSNIFDDLIANVKSDTLALKWKYREMKTFRGYNYKQAIDEITALAESGKQDNNLRIMAVEALGWYSLYYDKDRIIEACRRIAGVKANSEALRSEAEKTINRLQAGLNNPLIP